MMKTFQLPVAQFFREAMQKLSSDKSCVAERKRQREKTSAASMQSGVPKKARWFVLPVF
jgi:hypothetical protein